MSTVSSQPAQPAAHAGPTPAGKKIARILILAAIGLAGACIFAARVNPAHMDYISYWSTAKLLVHHADPYSPSAVFALEKPLGFTASHPLIMRNPPWALFLVAPLGFLGPRAGMVLWVLALGACIIVSVQLLNPGSKDNALALLFAPAIACIGSGQSSPFLLLGFALFLLWHRRRPWLAGAALLLMAFKPHLFLVFWAVLLAESIYKRRYQVLAGFAAALLVTTGIALAIDPRVWPQYISMLRASALELEAFPTASMLFRLLVSPTSDWLLFLPAAIAILWGLWYYARHRRAWDWTTHGMLLMLVTVMTSPYGWFTDEVVLLPTLIFALNLPRKSTSSAPSADVILSEATEGTEVEGPAFPFPAQSSQPGGPLKPAFGLSGEQSPFPKNAGWALLAINAVAVLVYTAVGAKLESPYLLWTPITWLAWFLYATRRRPLHSSNSAAYLSNQPAP